MDSVGTSNPLFKHFQATTTVKTSSPIVADGPTRTEKGKKTVSDSGLERIKKTLEIIEKNETDAASFISDNKDTLSRYEWLNVTKSQIALKDLVSLLKSCPNLKGVKFYDSIFGSFESKHDFDKYTFSKEYNTFVFDKIIPLLKNLEEIRMREVKALYSRWPIESLFDDSFTAVLLQGNTKLKVLEFCPSYHKKLDELHGTLNILKSNKTLTSFTRSYARLDISFPNFPADKLVEVLQESSLKEINFENSVLDDKGFRKISEELQSNKTIELFRFFQCKIRDHTRPLITLEHRGEKGDASKL